MSATRERADLVELLRHRLATHGYPRLQTFILLAAAGGLAFLVSTLGKRAGLDHLGVRYAIATLAGYGMFLVLIRLWIKWQRGRWEEQAEVDVTSIVDAGEALLPRQVPDGMPSVFASGRSGGGGATASWASPGQGPAEHARTAVAAQFKGSGGGSSHPSASLDVGDIWPIIVAALCATGGVAIIGYTIYMAPLLLAEVALDAAVVTTVYRRLRKEDAGTWVRAALRRTWRPALAIVILMGIAGSALQVAAPEARSLGEVVRTIRTK